MTADKLPPLPYPIVQTGPLTRDIAVVDHFTAADMHAYALAAVEMARPRWTTQVPTVEGWYWVEYPMTFAREILQVKIADGVGKSKDALVAVSCCDYYPLNHEGFRDCQWSDSPLPEPLEPKP